MESVFGARETHMHRVRRYVLTRFDVELDRHHRRLAGVHEQPVDGRLELEDDDGHVGTGFFHSVTDPLPSLRELQDQFQRELADQVVGASPFAWVNRVERPRGGNVRPSIFHPGVEQAMWDLQGQILGPAALQLLGGDRDKVPAYASGLEFHLTTTHVAEFYAVRTAPGFTDVQGQGRPPRSRLGHSTTSSSCRRSSVQTAVLMADANEAWSPKEAIRRVHAFQRRRGAALLDRGPVPARRLRRSPIDLARRCPTCSSTRRIPRSVGQATADRAAGRGRAQHPRFDQRGPQDRLVGGRARSPRCRSATPTSRSACTSRRRCPR